MKKKELIKLVELLKDKIIEIKKELWIYKNPQKYHKGDIVLCRCFKSKIKFMIISIDLKFCDLKIGQSALDQSYYWEYGAFCMDKNNRYIIEFKEQNIELLTKN